MSRRQWAGSLLVLGAIANCFFLVTHLTGATLPPADTFVSELGSAGQPGAVWFRISDVVTGVLLMAGIALGWSEVWPGRWMRLAQSSVFLFGLCTAIDGFAPMDCVPSIDRACRAKELAGDVSVLHHIHTVTGVLEGIAVSVALFAFAFATWHLPRWKGFARVTLVVAFAYLGLNMLISYQYLDMKPGIGIVQRAQILIFAGVAFAVGVGMLRIPKAEFAPRRFARATADFEELLEELPSAPGSTLRLQIHHAEADGPVAVFCNGLGLPLDHWFGVVGILRTPCVLFDRPGLGGSSPWAQAPDRIVDELALLSDVIRAHGRGKVVLVGHSWGGVLAEVEARIEPELVAGLVLVDPSDPREEALPTGAEQASSTRRRAPGPRSARVLSKGFVARMLAPVFVAFSDLVGTAQRDALKLHRYSRAWFRRPQHVFATLSELWREPLQAADAVKIIESTPLPDLAVTHLVGAAGGWPMHRPQTAWVKRAHARAAEHGGDVIEVDGAHLLMLDQPGAVAEAIAEVVSRAGGGSEPPVDHSLSRSQLPAEG